jgi:hypothetical protein
MIPEAIVHAAISVTMKNENGDCHAGVRGGRTKHLVGRIFVVICPSVSLPDSQLTTHLRNDRLHV